MKKKALRINLHTNQLCQRVCSLGKQVPDTIQILKHFIMMLLLIQTLSLVISSIVHSWECIFFFAGSLEDFIYFSKKYRTVTQPFGTWKNLARRSRRKSLLGGTFLYIPIHSRKAALQTYVHGIICFRQVKRQIHFRYVVYSEIIIHL